MSTVAEVLTDDELWAVLSTRLDGASDPDAWAGLAFALARALEHAHLADGECWCAHLYEDCLVSSISVGPRRGRKEAP